MKPETRDLSEPTMRTAFNPILQLNAKTQSRKVPPSGPGMQPACSASWRLRVLALNSVCAAVLAVAAAVLLPSAARAQGAIEAWVQRYDGPGNGDDWASAMAVDGASNVYVTGSWTSIYDPHDYGWATLKYSSEGVPLWTNLYNGNQAFSVAVDASNNVYVMGSWDDGTGARCTTLKYSSAGVPLWTNRYSPSGSVGMAMAVDASGNVAVVGGLSGNYLTLKYSSAGALLWARQYNGPANGTDWAGAVAVDASGNVYVTGRSQGSGSGEDYATVAYSSTGMLLWAQRYNGLGNGHDYPAALAVDGSGNVCVTGRSQSSSADFGYSDYLTIKYSGTGLPLWTNRYNGPGDYGDEATALALDPSGNVYVTGFSDGSSTDYATIKYSSAGVPLWTNRYDGPAHRSDLAKALVVDNNGNVFVTGWSRDSTEYEYPDYATVAYSSAGALLWSKRYNGPGNKRDQPWAVAVDASGSVYVTGQSAGSSSGVDFATLKYVIPPIITRQPLSQTNAVGTLATFTVETAGSLPFSYQWRRDGTNLLDGGNLSGVTTTNLQIANVQATDAAGYSVVVTNAYGSVTSTVAQLTVTIPPSPGRFTRVSYSPETGFSFIFRDATLGRPYRIQRSPSMAEGSWVDWQSFAYTEPIALTDLGATGQERRFYRAVSP